MKWRKVEETLVKSLMVLATLVVTGSLFFILITIIWRGLPGLNLAMITQTPKGGFYLGKEGGILNAIVGSLCLAGIATALATLIALPTVIYLHLYAGQSRLAGIVRLALDVLWGVPSIVLGALGFAVMLYLGMRASLLGGALALTLLEIPIMARAMDEAMAMVPRPLKESSFSLGATRLETAWHVLIPQTAPGLLVGILLAFGRAIGDAASVLFTAGFTDRLPDSLFSPVASLPLAIFFQLGTPFPTVQQRAYTSALVLTIIILILSLASRWLSGRLRRNVVR
jgi:phosphate transport system permease protein